MLFTRKISSYRAKALASQRRNMVQVNNLLIPVSIYANPQSAFIYLQHRSSTHMLEAYKLSVRKKKKKKKNLTPGSYSVETTIGGKSYRL